MKQKVLKSIISFCIVAITIWACQKESIVSIPQTAQAKTTQAKLAAQDQSQMIAATQTVMSITSGGFGQKGMSGGRIADGNNNEEDDDELGGCKPSIKRTSALDTSHKDSLIYSGTITIDYGNGSNCSDSTHLRKGKITDAFVYIISFKDSLQFSSSETITFDGFHKDTVQVDGTIIIKSSSAGPTTVEAKDAKITYKDGTSASWHGTLTYHYEKGEDRHWRGSTIRVTGSLSGTTRSGLDFTATITKEIVYQYGCFGKHKFTPVSGTVDVVTGGVTSTVDYGDGTCHTTFTITTGGVVTTQTLG